MNANSGERLINDKKQIHVSAVIVDVELPTGKTTGYDVLEEATMQLNVQPDGCRLAAVNGRNATVANLEEAVKSSEQLRVLASPFLYIGNNERGTVSVGERLKVDGKTIHLTDELDLHVRATSKNDVVLNLKNTRVDLRGFKKRRSHKSRRGRRVPVLSMQKLSTLVTLKSGEIGIVGGLIRREGLKRYETIVFVQPTVLDGSRERT